MAGVTRSSDVHELSTNSAAPTDPRRSLGSIPPGGSGKGNEGSRATFEGICGTDYPLYVFTARTCLELLPTLSPVQVDTELKHLRALDGSVDNALTQVKTKLKIEDKRNWLHKTLTFSLMKQIDAVVHKYDSLLESISRSVETAEKKMDEAQVFITQRMNEAQQHVEQLQQREEPPPPSSSPPATVRESEPLDNPVRFLDISFSGIEPSVVENAFVTEKSLPGNRTSAYFGKVGYSYGHRGSISHEPSEYPPNNDIFQQIFSRISEQDPNFTPENYTCLVNKYPNGQSTLAMHQDNESCIVPGSLIYTVSFGAPRTLRLFNTQGPLQEQRHTLEHGSVHVMTPSSQSNWKHGIVKDPQVTDCRISLTFRWLAPPAEDGAVSSRAPVPRIAQPGTSTSQPARVLFLTDSVHSTTPDFVFDSIPNHICIKQVEYQLENIDKYSSQFEYTDIVVISMGINDISRYGHNATSLFDIISLKMNYYARKYYKTKFIFNSLLLTRDFEWCNVEVKRFNSEMFGLAKNIRNLSFFDSHGLLLELPPLSGNRCFYESGNRSRLTDKSMRDSQSNNGIHICLQIRKLVMGELVKSVGYLTGSRPDKFRNSGWLYHAATQTRVQ